MRFLRRLTAPASDTQMGLVIGLSMVVMAMLLIALLWQSNVILFQRELIRSMWNWKFNG